MNIDINFLSGAVQHLEKVRNFHYYENPMESRIVVVDDQIFVHSCSPSSIESIVFVTEELDESQR